MPLTQAEDALREATEALREATEALRSEKRTRTLWLVAIFGVIALLATLGFLGFKESREIDREQCQTSAQGRQDLTKVLAIVVESGRERRTPEEQARTEALFDRIVSEALPPIDCSKI